MRPQTNGMVERFPSRAFSMHCRAVNGRIEDVLQSHHFNSREDLEQTLMRYVHLYNTQLPQSALKARTPMLEMKEWYSRKPKLFKKQPYYLTGCDTYHRCWLNCRERPFAAARGCTECCGAARQCGHWCTAQHFGSRSGSKRNEEDFRCAAPRTGRICLIRCVVVRRLLIGRAENAA